MTTIAKRPLTSAIQQWLETETGRPLGLHKAPANTTYPYLTLWEIDGGGFWGQTLTDETGSAEVVYQVDSVAATIDQLHWMADRVRDIWLGRYADGTFKRAFPAITGWQVSDRRPDAGVPGVDVEGDPPNEVYTLSERFVVVITPS